MIKNIPNKMSDKHLIDFISDVCPRKIDFLYLRMCVPVCCLIRYLINHALLGISPMGVTLDTVGV